MTTDRRFVDALLDTALDLPPRRRDRFLDQRCPPELRGRLERLLSSCQEGGDELGEGLEEARRVIAEEVRNTKPKRVRPGDRLDRFEIMRELARGGTSVVYQARDLEGGDLLALKVLHHELLGVGRVRARFLAEAKAAGRLRHEAVCRVEDVGELPDGRLFLVMPLYRGTTLAERLETLGRVDPEMAIAWAVQVASGLECAHRAQIVHRDIKPSNLFLAPVLDAHGAGAPRGALRIQVKILDFGVAKLIGEGPTRPGDRVGTLAYMSPEQARGEAIDARTDLWALGVVLFEMLTGKRPFAGRHLVELVLALQRDDPPPLQGLLPGLPAAVDEVVQRALAKDPADRWPSAADMGRALAAALD